jgi:hypothetical protein
VAEGTQAPLTNGSAEEPGGATADELDALLNGAFIPRSLPVTVFLPPALSSGPVVRMESPARGPVPGMVDIGVALDGDGKWGFAVRVAGASPVGFGADVDEGLGHVVRRGGIWGLAGQVWKAMAL